MWRRAARLAGLLVMMGCGSDGPAPEPITLEDACQRYAEAACKKNAECVPPIDADCISKQVDQCLIDANSGGPNCWQTAADSIAGCAPVLEKKTCDDYCNTSSSGSIFCFAPCIWLCPG